MVLAVGADRKWLLRRGWVSRWARLWTYDKGEFSIRVEAARSNRGPPLILILIPITPTQPAKPSSRARSCCGW
jgi:hypothetical protein